MFETLIDEYVAILDKDPLDQSKSTYVILEEFANKVIELNRQNLGQSNYYKKQHDLWID